VPGHSLGIEHLSVGWVEQVLVNVVEVRVVQDLVQSADVLEGVRIVVHLPHVVILEHGPEYVFRDVTKGVLVLREEVAGITVFVDVYLEVLSVGHV